MIRYTPAPGLIVKSVPDHAVPVQNHRTAVCVVGSHFPTTSAFAFPTFVAMSLARRYVETNGMENHATFVFTVENPNDREIFTPIVEFGPSWKPSVARTT